MCGSGDLTSVRIEEPQRWSRDGQPPERSMIDVDEEPLRAGLFPLVDLTQVLDFSCRNADGLQLLLTVLRSRRPRRPFRPVR